MQNLSFTFLDLLVVVIVVVSTGFAIYRGFVRETLSIFAWAAAAFATLYFGPVLAPMFHSRISPPVLGDLIAYAGIFLLVLIPLSFVSYRFSENVKHSPVGAVDRSLGLAFGVVRGFAIVGIAYLLFSMLVPPKVQPDWVRQARLLPLVQSSTEVLLSLVPERDTQFAHDLKPAPAPAAQSAVSKPAGPAAANPVRTATGAASRPAAKHGRKGYSAQERQGLNRLIQATGNGGHR